jgi:hypothetical protein
MIKDPEKQMNVLAAQGIPPGVLNTVADHSQ